MNQLNNSCRKKIAIGKIGKSILFDSTKWGALGGDNEAPVFYENLFHKNPNIDFYIVGLSDYSRLSLSEKNRINKHNNVYDIWENKLKWMKQNNIKSSDISDSLQYMEYWLSKNKDIFNENTAGLFFFGPTGASNVIGKTTKISNQKELSKVITMHAKYAAPIIHCINTTNLKYIGISNDPRYFPCTATDLIIQPKVILQQFNDIAVCKHRLEYKSSSLIHENIKCKYSGVETIFFIGKDKENQEKTNLEYFFDNNSNETKNIQFVLVCNEKPPYSRLNIFRQYVLDNIDDVEVYGKWNETIISNDKRFKGSKKFLELQNILKKAKYTFCIPPKKGWVTLKFWEMIYNSVIPFLHPDYDTQKNIDIPEFLYVKDSAELKEKIDFLENNPNEYTQLLLQLKSLIKPEFYSGDYLNTVVMEELNATCFDN